MELACPNCGTLFRVPDGAVSPGGRKVRCGSCGHVWTAYPDNAVEPEGEATPETSGAAASPPEDLAPTIVAAVEADGLAAGSAETVAQEATGTEPAKPDSPASEPGQLEAGAASPDAGSGGLDLESAPPDSVRPLRRSQPVLQPEPKQRWGLFFGWLLFFAVLGGLLGGGWYFREQVVAQVPQTARLYEALGIPVQLTSSPFVLDWRRAIQTEATGPTVTLSGQVINATEEPLPVPQLAVVLLNAQGNQIDSWAVEVGGGPLAPGEARDFTTKGPWPQSANDVSVRLLQ